MRLFHRSFQKLIDLTKIGKLIWLGVLTNTFWKNIQNGNWLYIWPFFYQMTLASVPSLSVALDGGATAPIDHILSVDEVANIDFSFSVFNPPTKVAVQVDHVCSLIQRHPNKLFLQPSLTHPKVLCPSLPYVRFGVALENEILSTSILPDFDFSLTQQQAECLLSILNCPGTIRTIRTIRHESKQVVQKKQVQWKYRSPEAHSQHESQSLSRSETSFLKSV